MRMETKIGVMPLMAGGRVESARSSLSDVFPFTKAQSDVHNLRLLHYIS